jgi:hypothetical protein
MPNDCILTDSTAQYTQSNFPGHERVHGIQFGTQKATHQEGHSLPGGVIIQEQLIPPSSQEFIQSYARLSRAYDSILVLTLASLLNPIMKHVLSALKQYSNGAIVEVIDSQTTAIGLGALVQLAAGTASEGASLREIRQQLVPVSRLFICCSVSRN